MRAARSARIAFAIGASVALSGCVAAAIPVLAAGGLVKSRTDGNDERADPGPRVALPAESGVGSAQGSLEPPRVAEIANPAQKQPASATTRDYAFNDGSQVTVINNLGRSVPAEAPGQATPAGARITGLTALPAPSDSTGDGKPKRSASVARLTTLTALPPPSGSSTNAADEYSGFASFVSAQAGIPIVGSERKSAILADSASLSGETRPCSIHPAAVLIDLDPVDGLVETTQVRQADSRFAAQLAAMRREEVVIGWTSNRTADRAGAIRAALRTSGLDPEGRDQLVLLRFPEESKQSRRAEFARSHCVVAIAGDERGDFDELFTYLRDPAAAAPLEKLIGAGWFIVPTPLPN